MFGARAAKALAARPAIPKLPLNLAELVEARRYARLAEHKQVLNNNQIQHDMRRAVELHNQAVETHQMEGEMRTGLLASHAHPIQAAMARAAAPVQTPVPPDHDQVPTVLVQPQTQVWIPIRLRTTPWSRQCQGPSGS